MSTPGASWRRCAEAWLLLAAVATATAACAKPERVQIGQVMRMGPFVLRADSARVYHLDRRGVPPELEVEVTFTIGGGNRFDRNDFAEAVSRKGRVYLTTGSGWRDRCALVAVHDDKRTGEVHGRPPDGSSGYSLEIGNPYGEPKRFILDLGK
jgi:hypothetical protein